MSKQFKPKNHNEFKFLQATKQRFESASMEYEDEHQPNSPVVNSLENQATIPYLTPYCILQDL